MGAAVPGSGRDAGPEVLRNLWLGEDRPIVIAPVVKNRLNRSRPCQLHLADEGTFVKRLPSRSSGESVDCLGDRQAVAPDSGFLHFGARFADDRIVS